MEEEWKQEYLALDEVVGAEDRMLVERVQAGLRTGALRHGYLMPESERLIAHFQSLVLAAVGGDV